MAKQATLDDFNDDDKVEGTPMNIWNYKEQKELIGKIVKIEQGLYSERQITLDVDTEEVTLPSLSALDTKLSNAKVGQKVKIINKGEVKSKKTGRNYYDFEVYVK